MSAEPKTLSERLDTLQVEMAILDRCETAAKNVLAETEDVLMDLAPGKKRTAAQSVALLKVTGVSRQLEEARSRSRVAADTLVEALFGAAPATDGAPARTKPSGLYEKYVVLRNDGSSRPGGKHRGCDYFVLDLKHDKYARTAAYAYAKVCEAEMPELAADLRARLAKEEARSA